MEPTRWLTPGDIRPGMYVEIYNSNDDLIDTVEITLIAKEGDGIRVVSMHRKQDLPMYFVFLEESEDPQCWRLLDHIDSICFMGDDWMFHIAEHKTHF